GAKREAHPREDARIRVVHDLVRTLERFLVGIERVSVLHDELARTHHPEARPHFVPELRLDVIEIDRELLVTLDLFARNVGDDLLRRRLDDEVALVPILEAQKLRTVLRPTARLLP